MDQNMDQFRYRRAAKIVSVVDLIFYLILNILVLVCGVGVILKCLDIETEEVGEVCSTIIATILGFKLNFIEEIEEDSSETKFLPQFLVFLGIFGAHVVFATWGAIKLFKATEIEIHPLDAIPLLSFWGIGTIVFSIEFGFFYLATYKFIHLAVWLCTRGVFLSVAKLYMNELQAIKDAMDKGFLCQRNWK